MIENSLDLGSSTPGTKKHGSLATYKQEISSSIRLGRSSWMGPNTAIQRTTAFLPHPVRFHLSPANRDYLSIAYWNIAFQREGMTR
jgi:hypothetical protein